MCRAFVFKIALQRETCQMVFCNYTITSQYEHLNGCKWCSLFKKYYALVNVLFSPLGVGERGGRARRAGQGDAQPAADPEGGRHLAPGEPADWHQPGAPRQRHQGRGPVCRGTGQYGVSLNNSTIYLDVIIDVSTTGCKCAGNNITS